MVCCYAVRRVAADGVTLAVRDEGAGPAVLLLHGFPDRADLWRRQVPPFVEAGLRVLAPDLRGLGDSDRPEGVAEYHVLRSVADMVAVLDDAGVDRAHVVGHDFGAVVAWLLAALHPDRVDRLVVLSVGHPLSRALQTMEGREKGWYQLLFQFEGIAEELLARDDWRLLREWTRGDGDVERAIADLSRPGALTAGLNWYRANLHPAAELRPQPELQAVQAPTLGIWSSRDHYLTEDRMAGSGRWCAGPFRYERVEGASHWLMLDEPERVTSLVVGHLSA